MDIGLTWDNSCLYSCYKSSFQNILILCRCVFELRGVLAPKWICCAKNVIFSLLLALAKNDFRIGKVLLIQWIYSLDGIAYEWLEIEVKLANWHDERGWKMREKKIKAMWNKLTVDNYQMLWSCLNRTALKHLFSFAIFQRLFTLTIMHSPGKF